MSAEHQRLTFNYTQEPFVPFVIDAVYAMAHALDAMYRDVCTNTSTGHLCQLMDPPDGATLLDYVRRVNFTSKFALIIPTVVLGVICNTFLITLVIVCSNV